MMEGFLDRRGHQMDIFPFPEEGDTVYENPPCFVFLADPENNGEGYTLTLTGEDGFSAVYHTEKNYLTLKEPLPAGSYTWDVSARGMARGARRFTLAEDAVLFERPTAREIYEIGHRFFADRLAFVKRAVAAATQDQAFHHHSITP